MSSSPSVFRQTLQVGFILIVASYSYWMGRASTVVIPCGSEYPTISDVPTTVVVKSITTTQVGNDNGRNLHISNTNSNTILQSSSTSTNSYMSSWEESSIIVTISFGNATQTNLLERLLYSIKSNGQWHNGRIVVLTDHADYYRTQQKLESLYHPNLYIIQAKPEHLNPIDPKTNQPMPFITDAMRFKRFKVFILDYLDELFGENNNNNNSSSILSSSPSPNPPYTHVLYLDVEIVIARPIHGLFQDYLDVMIQRDVFGTEHADILNVSTTPPFMSFFTDCAKCARQNFHLNGGVFMLHYHYSRPCLQEWSNLFNMGVDYVKYDQRYLVVMKQQRDKKTNDSDEEAKLKLCKFHELPTHHRLYPTRKDMRVKRSATVVHNTNTHGAKKVPLHVQQAYFAYLLNTTAFTTDKIELF